MIKWIWKFYFNISGFSDEKVRLKNLWWRRYQQVKNKRFTPPKPKIFKAKHNLPNLGDYKRSAPDWFWQLFPRNDTCPATSLIDPDKLLELAEEVGFEDTDRLEKVH